jgi:lipopolysaccharide/colanic/teichoic acid biosynthesis glycosyltransferase
LTSYLVNPDGGYPGKRHFDFALSAILLVVTAPVLLGCALAILWSDGRPVLFIQERVGQWGRRFRIFKLRTMRQASGPAVTISGDPRITPLGRWLRRVKLDELPQLWNVIVGEMSLVGPRPEVPKYVALQARAFRAIAPLRPGVTDLASLIFRDEERVLATHSAHPDFYQQVLLPRKLALARLYSRHASLQLDLALLLATACVAFGAEHTAYRIVGERLYARARHLDAARP